MMQYRKDRYWKTIYEERAYGTAFYLQEATDPKVFDTRLQQSGLAVFTGRSSFRLYNWCII